VFNAVLGLAETNPDYKCSLRRLLLFREANAAVDLDAVLAHVPALWDLTLFGWEYIRVAPIAWRLLSSRLVNLELVGLGFNAVRHAEDSGEGSNSPVFDVALLGEATALRRLQVAGWGDTTLEMDQLFATLPRLESLYLEDVKISLKNGRRSSSCAKTSNRNSCCPKNGSCRRRKGWKGGEKEVGHRLTILNITHCCTAQVVFSLKILTHI